MTLSLYEATIPNLLQPLRALRMLLDKAEAFSTAHGITVESLAEARIAPDMLPFAYQVKSASAHSIGAIEGVRCGRLIADVEEPAADFAGMIARVVATIAALKALDPDEINGFQGRIVRMDQGAYRLAFTAEDFLMSLEIPNVHFHVSIAYALLRARGMPIGKSDFLGPVRSVRN